MTPQTDIVMPIRATRRYPIENYLSRCIETLYQHTSAFRLIVVDDNSDPQGAATIDALAKQMRDTLLIRSNYQRWFTRAVNLGLRMARTEWTAVVNTDVEFGPDWLEELYAVRDEASKVTGRRVGLVGSTFSAEEPRRWMESSGKDYVTAHCWLLSVPAFSEASSSRGTPGIYLDERHQELIHIRSDVQICWELNRLGWVTVKSFKSQVGHHGGKSWGHNLAEIAGVSLHDVSDHYQ